MNHVAHVSFAVKPVGYLTAVLTLHRNAVAFAVWLAGKRILADLLMRETFRLQPHAQILARLVIGNRLSVHWLKFKAGNQRAARRFLNDAEGARAFPAAVLAGIFAVDLRFAVDKLVCQHAVGFPPRVQHLGPG